MSKVNVLVVDDASFIRDLVKKCLRNYFPGMRIEDAINGRKAQAMLAKEAFDLVLCDWEMPEMSGLELLTWCCLLYTSPSPRDRTRSRMPSSA